MDAENICLKLKSSWAFLCLSVSLKGHLFSVYLLLLKLMRVKRFY